MGGGRRRRSEIENEKMTQIESDIDRLNLIELCRGDMREDLSLANTLVRVRFCSPPSGQKLLLDLKQTGEKGIPSHILSAPKQHVLLVNMCD